MDCPRCHSENPASAQFCVRCHATLRFRCPACQRCQDHAGKCDACGADFAKVAAAMAFQAECLEKGKREQGAFRNEIIKQALLLPVTGGWSLLKYVRNSLRGE